jgi:DNA-binding MarR family transcriptional regulator
MRLMWAVDHALQQASRRMKATLGVTGPQRLVVRMVGRFPGVSASELAALLHVHPSTLTGVLRRLERHGLVQRRRDPRDARRRLIGLTARGRLVDSQVNGTVEAAVHAATRQVRPAELAAARKVLEKMAVRLSGP